MYASYSSLILLQITIEHICIYFTFIVVLVYNFMTLFFVFVYTFYVLTLLIASFIDQKLVQIVWHQLEYHCYNSYNLLTLTGITTIMCLK